MKIKNILFFLLSLMVFVCHSQKTDVQANVEMDFFGNLYIDAKISDLDTKKDTLVIDDKILIHKNYASLLRGITLGKQYMIEYIPKTNELSYVINLPKSGSSTYLKRPNFFLSSISYLPTNKKIYDKKKRYKIGFNFPKKYKVIYPDESDLKEAYNFTPPIIAGEFYKSDILEFKIFNLRENNNKKKEIELFTEILNESYIFFQKDYPKRTSKPKIIFLPLNSDPSAKALENAILFDSSLLNDTINLQKRLISHEVSHMWWGSGSVRIDNPFVVEGIAEYMALKYMEYRGEKDYVNKFVNTKFYRVEGIESSSEIYKTTKVEKGKRKLLSYDFAPLLFLNLEGKESNLYENLSEFHKEHIDYEGEVPLQKLELFLEENGFQPLIKEGVLPDFFVVEKNDKIIIQGFNDFTEEVEIEFTDVNDNKSIETLSFSKENNLHKFDSKNYKKIIVDPKYKILQFSRLNDVWTKGENSLFSKNRYFSLEETKLDVISISTEFINYIESKNNVEISNLTCEDNLWLIKKIEKLKGEINKEGAFTITGGSAYYRESENLSRIDIKLAYFSEKEQKSKFAYFYLYYDKELKFLQNFRAMYPVEID